MKKLLLFVTFVICCLISKAQTSNWLWAESSDGGSYEYGYGVFVDTGGHIFTSGRLSNSGSFGALSYNASGTSPYVEKFDTSGSGIWVNATAFSGFDYCEGFCIDNKDNSYVAGIAGGSMLVGKYNKAGTAKWANIYNGPSPSGLGIAADNAGYVYFIGADNPGSVTMNSITVTNTGPNDATFLAKLDSNGTCIWAKSIQSSGGYLYGRDIVVDNQGNFYWIGDYDGTPSFGGGITAPASTGVSDLFIAKYDTAGNPIWVTTSTNTLACDFGGSVGLALDSCNNIYVTGEFENTATFGSFTYTSQGGEDGFVAKLNNSGQWQWVSAIGSAGRDAGFSICTDKHNEVYVGGDYGGTANLGNGVTLSGAGGGVVVKYSNSTGYPLWALGGVGSTAGHVYGMAVDKLGYAYTIGDFSGTATFGAHSVNCANGTSNIFLAKLDTVDPRVIVPVIDSSYCPGSTDTIPYSIVGSFNSGNTFSVQLSDSTGSFVNFVTIGTIISTGNGKIVITIPSNTPAGSNYLIRVVSSNPSTSSYVNGCGAYFVHNVYPNDFYVTIGVGKLHINLTPVNPNICAGGSITLKASGGISYTWSTGSTADSIVVSPAKDTSYMLTVSSGSTCTVDTTIKVTVNAIVPLIVKPQSPSVCNGQSVTLIADTTGTNYTWSPTTGLSATSGDSVVANPTATITYTVTGIDSLGCTATATDTVKVNTPLPLVINPPSPSLCSGQAITLVADTTGNTYLWIPSTGLTATTGDSVVANPTATITYTVTGIDSLGCSVTGTDVITVGSGPNKPIITVSVTGDTLISSAKNGNQWYVNGQPIHGATDSIYVITGLPKDTFKVAVTNVANGCSTTSDSVVVASGIEQLSINNNQLSIYPNPTNGTINVNINASATGVSTWSLQVIDVLGRTLFTRASLNYTNEIDLSNLPGGVYFITVINKSARVVAPVVKQN